MSFGDEHRCGELWYRPLVVVNSNPSSSLRTLAGPRLVTGWASEAPSFFVFRRSDLPLKVYRVDKATGHRTFFREIGLTERAGIGRTGLNLLMTSDGRSYLYCTRRNLSELYVVKDLE